MTLGSAPLYRKENEHHCTYRPSKEGKKRRTLFIRPISHACTKYAFVCSATLIISTWNSLVSQSFYPPFYSSHKTQSTHSTHPAILRGVKLPASLFSTSVKDFEKLVCARISDWQDQSLPESFAVYTPSHFIQIVT